MLELPEVLTLAKQLNENVVGKTVKHVKPPAKPHKFCWFNGSPTDYDEKINGRRVISATAFGIYAEIAFENNFHLCVNDGVKVALVSKRKYPSNYQLVIEFMDSTALVFTVSMYGGIILHDGNYQNEYYQKSLNYVSPFSSDFKDNYYKILAQTKPSLSLKAFLATKQRFPGICNGVCQDILLDAGLNPKRKLSTLTNAQQDKLLNSIVSVLSEMTEYGGRDTEKDLFGNHGGYLTKMSKNALYGGCCKCGGAVTKETYLGGSVYYCPNCQPLK